ncbi:pectinesterase family protein [Pelobium manganitolerans]|uniref:pectinesterase family protein n=1 Tax=Pelobium manganitolerans TaxID=1842495 RepID=UPI003FA36DFC
MKQFIKNYQWQHFVFVLLIFFTHSAFAVSYDKTVAKDGSGDYTTVQAAVDAAPLGLTAPYRIFIKKGKYVEQVTIPSNKPFIQFIGEDVGQTAISFNNYNGKAMSGGGSFGTANSATVIVNANDFSAANITFENTTGDSPQALAMNASGDRASFKNCRFLGGQDTFLGYNSKYPQSLYKCYIEGVVDFIFGNSKTVFDECTIYARDRADNNGSYITASNTRESKGLLFRNCEIIPNRGNTKYVLGRPWQNDAATTTDKSTAATVFINTKMSSVVKPEGWATWDAGTDVSKIIYAEYNSMNMDGTPLDVSSRVSWSKQLTATEAAEYLDNNIVFKDRNNVVWDPYAVFLDGNNVPSNRLAISNFKYKKTGVDLDFYWNLNWPESNVTYNLYRIADGGTPVLVNTQTISSNDVNLSYAPATGKETVPPSMSTYEYYVEATSASGTVRSESAIIAAIPVLDLTGALQDFKQGNDKASAPQILTLKGEYLLENVTVTPPANFEVSADNGATWATASSPLVLPVTSGLLTQKTLLLRLNAAAPGTYSGNLTIVSGTGSHNKTIAVSGETYDHPIFNSKVIANIALTDPAKNTGSTYLKNGLSSASLSLGSYVLSNKTSGTNAPYTADYGIQFGPNADGGGWGASDIKNMNDKTKYIEVAVKTASTHEARVDSLLFNLAVFQTSGNFAVEYSTDDFASSTLLKSGLLNGSPLTVAGSYATFAGGTWELLKQGAGTNVNRYAFALNASNGVRLDPGKTLKVRLYFRTGSSSNDRYVTLKNIDFKGIVNKVAVAGDYITVKSGSWDDVSVWKKYDGTTWNTVIAYPVYNSGGTSIIDNGHVISLPTISQGSGYVNNFTVREGGTLIIPSGASVKFANQSPNFVVEGEFINEGSVTNNGAVNMVVDGTVKNSGSNFKVGDATGATLTINGLFVNSATTVNFNNVTVTSTGTYQHDLDGTNMPANITFETGSTFLVSGITSSQTDIFKSSTNYYNIIWDNNQASGKYYAFRGNIGASNVLGKFTVKNTGATYIAFNNADITIGFPGGYEQTGGSVRVREGGTVNGTFNIGKDFVVSGGTFESNGANVTINLTGVNGVYNYNDVTNSLSNLNVGLSGSYTLQSPLKASTLVLSGNGKIALGNNNLNVAAVTGGSATAFVITDGLGKLSISNVGATAVNFPVGANSNSYSPVSISNSGAADAFSVSVKNTFTNALPSPSKAVNKEWSINEATAGDSNATLAFSWNTTDQGAGFSTSQLRVLNYDGTAWTQTNASLSGDGSTTPYTATASGFTAFGAFAIGTDGVLPLDFTGFSAKLLKNLSQTVQLNWTTANEVNTSHFVIERSADGKTFETLGTLASKNIAGENRYQFIDEKPLAGFAYYRIKQVDQNAAFKYSTVQAINNAGQSTFAVYPNPAQNVVYVSHVAAGKSAKISVVSTLGKNILQANVAAGSVKSTLNLSGLASGVYLLYYQDGANSSVTKLVKP